MIEWGLYCMGITLGLLVATVYFAVGYAHWNAGNWWWNLTAERHMTDEVNKAYALNAVVDDLEAGYKKVHYRHNIHCGHCGRFAKQAEGWAPGMAYCKYHGISAKFMTHPSQGHVEVIIETIPDYVVAILEPVPQELTPLWDTEWPEIVIDYSPDELGLPVFTVPLTADDLFEGKFDDR